MEDREDMEGSGACCFMENCTRPTFVRNGEIYEDTPSMRFLSWIRVLIFSTIISCEKIAESLQKMFDIVGHSFKGPLSFYDNGMIFIINDFQKDFNVYGNILRITILRDADADSTELVSSLIIRENEDMECGVRYTTRVERREYILMSSLLLKKTTWGEINNICSNSLEDIGMQAYPTLQHLKAAMQNQKQQNQRSLLIAILVSRREGRKKLEVRRGLWLPSELWELISADFPE